MSAECTNVDHSEYKRATNFWGLERKTGELNRCAKCGLPSFDFWFNSLPWEVRDPVFWKQVFDDAVKQKAFFFKAVVPGIASWQYTIYFDADCNDPSSRLRPTHPEWLTNTYGGDISAAIKQTRYLKRRTPLKEHNYGRYQPSIDRQISLMLEGLDCTNNVRFAALDSRKDMRRYNDAKEKGCCGSHDEVVTIYGRHFTIGCNYGH